MSEETISISKALLNDLRLLYRAARGIRNKLHYLTSDDCSKPDWDFARECKRIFPTLSNLSSIVTLIETKMFAPEDKCPNCGHELS